MSQPPKEVRQNLTACTTGCLINLAVPGILYEAAGAFLAQTIFLGHPYVEPNLDHGDKVKRRENRIRALSWDIARTAGSAILFFTLKDNSPALSDIAGLAALVYGISTIVMTGEIAIDKHNNN